MNINNLTGNINNNKTDYFPKGKDDKVTMLLVQSEQLLDVDSTKIVSTRVSKARHKIIIEETIDKYSEIAHTQTELTV